jgi:hypothetical protein
MTDTTTDLVIVDPRDGTLLEDLTDEPTDQLAIVAVELKAREQHLQAMRAAVEGELTNRVQAAGRRSVHTTGHELKVEQSEGRVWDPEDLEDCLRELVDAGTLTAGELTGLITHETKVNGKQAQKLLGSLDGQPRGLLERCYRWEKKGRPRLVITPLTPLIEETIGDQA